MMRRATIIDYCRSAFGKGRDGGILSSVHPVDLLAQVLQALVDRTGIDPGAVDDVIAGCVLQVGEQSANIARQAWLAAGLPTSVPAVTIDRKCGSCQQAIHFAAQGIVAGAYDLVIACGVDMMSRVAMKSNRMGRDNLGPMFRKCYPDGLVNQGISAELIAAKWNISREEMDSLALRSHLRADRARQRGSLAAQIVSIPVAFAGGITQVLGDEGIRTDTSADKLARLPVAFEDPEMKARFPQINWSVTPGNSSQITDGAAAILLASEETAIRLGLSPKAAVTHFALAGDDPIMMLTGPIPATQNLLQRANLTVDQIDLFEVNEAFASVVLAWQRELKVDPERVNVDGGAIAFGHPVGASGGRLTASLINGLIERRGRYGLQTMCESGGLANAMLVERL
jgi:acetyl-CoA acetyltransferase family protein